MFANRTRANIIGILLTLAALVSLGFSWKSTADNNKQSAQLTSFVRCQSDWTNFFYQAITAGRTANADAQAALDDLVQTVSNAKSRAETEAALERYKAAREKQKQSLTDHPLPEAPKEACQLED